MSVLTTVTVEGNVNFENYAFRSCPNLSTVYLLGDDVTFSGSQFACHSDNGDATDITIYVKNATVAARVYAAQTSAYGYEVKILGDAADGSDASEVTQVKNDTQLADAITAGASTVVLGSGTYTFPNTALSEGVTLYCEEGTVFNGATSCFKVCCYGINRILLHLLFCKKQERRPYRRTFICFFRLFSLQHILQPLSRRNGVFPTFIVDP